MLTAFFKKANHENVQKAIVIITIIRSFKAIRFEDVKLIFLFWALLFNIPNTETFHLLIANYPLHENKKMHQQSQPVCHTKGIHTQKDINYNSFWRFNFLLFLYEASSHERARTRAWQIHFTS